MNELQKLIQETKDTLNIDDYELSKRLNVSKLTITNWFSGKSEPYHLALNSFVSKLSEMISTKRNKDLYERLKEEIPNLRKPNDINGKNIVWYFNLSGRPKKLEVKIKDNGNFEILTSSYLIFKDYDSNHFAHDLECYAEANTSFERLVNILKERLHRNYRATMKYEFVVKYFDNCYWS